jgi:hypothetical protein
MKNVNVKNQLVKVSLIKMSICIFCVANSSVFDSVPSGDAIFDITVKNETEQFIVLKGDGFDNLSKYTKKEKDNASFSNSSLADAPLTYLGSPNLKDLIFDSRKKADLFIIRKKYAAKDRVEAKFHYLLSPYYPGSASLKIMDEQGKNIGAIHIGMNGRILVHEVYDRMLAPSAEYVPYYSRRIFDGSSSKTCLCFDVNTNKLFLNENECSNTSSIYRLFTGSTLRNHHFKIIQSGGRVSGTNTFKVTYTVTKN